MSLDTTPTSFALGLIAAKDFDSSQVLDDLLGPKLATIRHLYTNGANSTVLQFALANGLAHTTFPITGGRGLPASTRDIVDASEVVLIIATPGSKSATQVGAICKAKAERDPTFKWRVEKFDPVSHWRTKVGQVAEIIASMSKEDMGASPWASAAWKVVGSK